MRDHTYAQRAAQADFRLSRMRPAPARACPQPRPRRWRSWPIGTFIPGWRGVAASIATSTRGSRSPHEDRPVRSYGHFVMGQWPCHHLSFAAQRAGRARSRHRLHRERTSNGIAITATCPHPPSALCTYIKTGTKASARLLAIARDADVIVVGSYFPDTIAAVEALIGARLRTHRFLRYRHSRHPRRARGGRPHGLPYSHTDPPLLRAYLSFSGGLAHCRRWSKLLERARPWLFCCSVDPDLYSAYPCRQRTLCLRPELPWHLCDRPARAS